MRLEKDILLVMSFTIIIISIISAFQANSEKITGYAAGSAKICVGNTPSLVDIGNLNATTGVSFSYDVNHTVAGSDDILYSDTASLFDIDPNSGEIIFIPQESNVGNHTIIVHVNNSACVELGDMEELNFEIILGNRAPILDTIENQTVWEDGYCGGLPPPTLCDLYLEINATDPDGDNITYACNDTSYFTVNETTGVIEWSPTNDDVGLHWFDCNATDDYGAYDSQEFFVFVRNDNDAPILDIIDNFTVENNTPVYEDKLFQYDVNATDPDGDAIEYLSNATYDPILKDVFYIDEDTGEISFIPSAAIVGNHSVEIYASDGSLTAEQVVLVEILAVNDPPLLGSIGAQTAKINSSFYLQVNASDDEDGTNYGGKLTFTDNITFLNSGTTLFEINLTTGVITFTPTDDDLGNYTINITVTDNGIPEYGQSNATDSEVISFSVTEANRPPNITDYTPETPFSMETGQSQGFTIIVEDDVGTPSAKWYLDGSLVKEDSLSLTYTYTFTPLTATTYNLTVVITDGEFDDSQEWAITVTAAPTPPGAPGAAGGGGGGGGGGRYCKEVWVCTDWSTCTINDIQIRVCRDLKECGTSIFKPREVRSCIYSPVPSCFDYIRNQNEILPDCGGVCKRCPTCNDGICNQGELCEICDENPHKCPLDLDGNIMVDCGGPCPLCPKIERVVQPKTTRWRTVAISVIKISIIILLILLILLIIIIRILRHVSKKAVLTKQEKTELELVNKIDDLVIFAEKAIDMKDLEQLKLACANIERLYNSLSSTKNKKKIYPKIKKLKRAIRVGL